MPTCPCCGQPWTPRQDFIVDLNTNTVLINGEKLIYLEPAEAEVLTVIAEAAPYMVEREVLIHKVWGRNVDVYADRQLSVYMSRIRRKLEGTGFGFYVRYKLGVRLVRNEAIRAGRRLTA